MTNEERIAVLETKDATKDKQLTVIDQKLDELLALRNKGLGAFWLASALFGAGLLGAINLVIGWFKHG